MDKTAIVSMVGIVAMVAVLVGCINSPRFGDIYAVNPSIQTGNGNVATVASQGVGQTSEYKGRQNGPLDTAVGTGRDVTSAKTIDAATEMELVKQLRGANAGTGSSQQTGNPQDNDQPSIEIPLTTGTGAAASTAGSAAGGIIGKVWDKIAGDGKEAKPEPAPAADTWTCATCKTVNPHSAYECSKCGGPCPTCVPK